MLIRGLVVKIPHGKRFGFVQDESGFETFFHFDNAVDFTGRPIDVGLGAVNMVGTSSRYPKVGDFIYFHPEREHGTKHDGKLRATVWGLEEDFIAACNKRAKAGKGN